MAGGGGLPLTSAQGTKARVVARVALIEEDGRMGELPVMARGESFIGKGADAAHLNTILGRRDGPEIASPEHGRPSGPDRPLLTGPSDRPS